MYKHLDPLIRFFVLILNCILIFYLNSTYAFVLYTILTVLFLLLVRANFFKYYKYISFGLFIALFTFSLTYYYGGDLTAAFQSGEYAFIVFFLIFLQSIIFKANTTNRETAYVISFVFRIFEPFGYNQNKMYTIILLILNNIYSMRQNVIMVYRFEKMKFVGKLTWYRHVKLVLGLIVPFINRILYENETASLALINKGYSIDNKHMRFFKNYPNEVFNIILVIIIELLYIVILNV